MGKSCIVCKSCSDRRPELIFHRFPKDEKLRKTWIKNMGIKKVVSKFSTICSIHFAEECFKTSMASTRPILIKGSVPTIFTEEELMEQETMQDESTSDSINSGDDEILEEFTPPRELQSDSENEKMVKELQYSCRKIRVKGLKWEQFRTLPDALQEMHWTEAQHLIEEQSRELKLLQQKNRRCHIKIENLNLFTRSMKREIAKRARNYKIESP